MTSRFIDPVPQFFDDAGEPLGGGKLYFYESGDPNTLRPTYTDSDLTTENANPVILDGAGRPPNIFLQGNYKLIITDSDDVQIEERDPVSSSLTAAEFSDWSPLETYSVNNKVRGSDGQYYQSITNSNLGNNPTSTPANWEKIVYTTYYNANQTYSIDDVVNEGGILYRSITNSNTGNTPSTDGGTNWVIYPGESRGNLIINGNFDIWQRGTSFTNPNAEYTADRWQVDLISGGAGDATQQAFTLGQTDVPGEPKYYMRLDTTTARTGNASLIRQRIEDVRTLAGSTGTLSFYAKASIAKTLTLEVQQRFGSGGTASANNTVLSSTFDLTTSWQKFEFQIDFDSIAAKTIDGDDSNIQVSIQELTTYDVFTLDLAQVQLEKGAYATEFERRPIGEELALCQRYFFRTDSNFIVTRFYARSSAVGYYHKGYFPVTLRATPTITETTTASTNVGSFSIDTAFDHGISYEIIPSANLVDVTFRTGIEADAEL